MISLLLLRQNGKPPLDVALAEPRMLQQYVRYAGRFNIVIEHVRKRIGLFIRQPVKLSVKALMEIELSLLDRKVGEVSIIWEIPVL